MITECLFMNSYVQVNVVLFHIDNQLLQILF